MASSHNSRNVKPPEPVIESRDSFRRRWLEGLGAQSSVLEELLAYGAPATTDDVLTPQALPLADEPHVSTWCQYQDEARRVGAIEALEPHFVQLRFPIQAGISQHDAYRRATRQGRFEEADQFDPKLRLRRPDDVELVVHRTMGGRVPVLTVADRADFVTLLQALTERNEPAPVPPSLGACLVRGLNNWGRIADYRAEWEQRGGVSSDWPDEFRRLSAQKPLYQDRLVILSRGPYSSTNAADIDSEESEWLERSLIIRREHEFTHYFTYRLFGSIRSHVLDELVADYVGLVHAFGRYQPALARRFLGLESYPRYRPDGRLGMYRGKPPLSDAAMPFVRDLAYRIIDNLGRLAVVGSGHDPELPDLTSLGQLTRVLFSLSLEELASDEGPRLVKGGLDSARG